MSVEILELTPRGAGGVSVLRIRGAGALALVREIAPRARAEIQSPQLVRLRARDEELDEAIVCVLSPAEIELHLHGSPPLIARILGILRAADEAHATDKARAPDDGCAPEKVRAPDKARAPDEVCAPDDVCAPEEVCAAKEVRAALETRAESGSNPARSTLQLAASCVEAAAWSQLARAVSESGARILLDQAEGALRRSLLALAPAAVAEREVAVRELLARGRIARFALDPAEVVLAGATNAGKSTLFNLLLGEDRVIVSDEEGTTRDAVRERAAIGAYPVFLTDTVGQRAISGSSPTADMERAARAHALRSVCGADLVLRLVRADAMEEEACDFESQAQVAIDLAPEEDATLACEPGSDRSAAESERRPRFALVHSQADRVRDARRARLVNSISVLRDPSAARRRIGAIFHATFNLPSEPWSPGAGVPFDTRWMSGVAALPIGAPRDAWLNAVQRFLGAE
jgi:50S ribosome-binding GTPase/GTP-binding protein TrmE N-terminus